MLVQINCPNCGTDGSMSFQEENYKGPYRCWKCRSLFTIQLDDYKLLSCEPLSEEECQRQQNEKAIQDKLHRQFNRDPESI